MLQIDQISLFRVLASLCESLRISRQGLVNDEVGELENPSPGVKRETFGCGQLGNSVDHSPRKQRELKRVSSGQLSLVLTCLDEGRQRPEGLFGGFGLVRTRALRNRRIEHHRKVLRSTESELDVGESGDFQSIQRLRLPLGGVAHGPGQLPESLGSDGCQKFFPIRKVPIRGVVGDACAPGDFPQSKARGTDLADQLNCRFQQSFFQMGVVVRLSWTHSSQQHTTYGWHEQHPPPSALRFANQLLFATMLTRATSEQ